MARDALEDARTSLRALLEAGRRDAACSLLERLHRQSLTYQQARALADLYHKEFPPAQLAEPDIQPLFLRALCAARRPERILEHLAEFPAGSALELYRAWALVRGKQYAAGLEIAQGLTEVLDPALQARVLGEAMFHLGRPEWEGAFEQARTLAGGVTLGRTLLDYGHYLNLAGRRAEARVAWAEALAHLRGDPFYLAWARHNLGFSLIKDHPEEAETHLLEAVRLSRRGPGRAFGCRALVSLGALRRSLGELERALDAYRRALNAEGDAEDRYQALWGCGHALRLMGRPEEALGWLLEASRLDPAETWVHADIAACRLMLGDERGARDSLGRVVSWGERSSVVRAVVEAELARRGGGGSGAGLRGLDPAGLWAREELGCFPGLRPTDPLNVHRPYRVSVNPWGLLEVRVNGRAVPLNPLGKPGELLVFLVLHGGAASLERLTDRLCDDRLRNKPKALWEHAKALRLALGWPDSVQAGRGTYRLDPAAEWACAEEPLPLGSAEFMHGHYGDWVLERRPLVV